MTMFNKVTKTFQWGQHTVTMETGEVARQSTGAVVCSIGDTVVLATVVAKSEAKAGQDLIGLLRQRVVDAESSGRWTTPLVLASLLLAALAAWLAWRLGRVQALQRSQRSRSCGSPHWASSGGGASLTQAPSCSQLPRPGT